MKTDQIRPNRSALSMVIPTSTAYSLLIRFMGI
jgi:hypothetical protein